MNKKFLNKLFKNREERKGNSDKIDLSDPISKFVYEIETYRDDIVDDLNERNRSIKTRVGMEGCDDSINVCNTPRVYGVLDNVDSDRLVKLVLKVGVNGRLVCGLPRDYHGIFPIKINGNKTLDQCIVEETPTYIIYSDGVVTPEDPIPEGIYFACYVDKINKTIYTGKGCIAMTHTDLLNETGMTYFPERVYANFGNSGDLTTFFSYPEGYVNGPLYRVAHSLVGDTYMASVKDSCLHNKYTIRAYERSIPENKNISGFWTHGILDSEFVDISCINKPESGIYETTILFKNKNTTSTNNRIVQLRNHKDGSNVEWECKFEYLIQKNDLPLVRTKCPSGKITIHKEVLNNLRMSHINAKPKVIDIVKDGLVLWVDGRDGNNTDQTNVWVDRSGNNNNMNITGCKFNDVSGWTGTGLKFDTTTKLSGSIPSLQSRTIEARFSIDSFTPSWVGVLSSGGDARRGFYIQTPPLTNTVAPVSFLSGSLEYGHTNINRYTSITNTSLLFETTSGDNGVSTIYMNTNQKYSQTGCVSDPITLVETNGGCSTIYSIRVYNRPLTPEEIRHNYGYDMFHSTDLLVRDNDTIFADDLELHYIYEKFEEVQLVECPTSGLTPTRTANINSHGFIYDGKMNSLFGLENMLVSDEGFVEFIDGACLEFKDNSNIMYKTTDIIEHMGDYSKYNSINLPEANDMFNSGVITRIERNPVLKYGLGANSVSPLLISFADRQIGFKHLNNTVWQCTLGLGGLLGTSFSTRTDDRGYGRYIFLP